MAYVPDSQRSEAEAEGWICWDETLTLSPSDSVGANTFASNTMQRLSGPDPEHLPYPRRRPKHCPCALLPSAAAGAGAFCGQYSIGDKTMKQLDLSKPSPAAGRKPGWAQLVRHLDARLRDFGPGGPAVVSADQCRGVVSARFPGHDTAQVLEALRTSAGISAALEGDLAVFYLSPQVPFEELDRLWGCLFQLL